MIEPREVQAHAAAARLDVELRRAVRAGIANKAGQWKIVAIGRGAVFDRGGLDDAIGRKGKAVGLKGRGKRFAGHTPGWRRGRPFELASQGQWGDSPVVLQVAILGPAQTPLSKGLPCRAVSEPSLLRPAAEW